MSGIGGEPRRLPSYSAIVHRKSLSPGHRFSPAVHREKTTRKMWSRPVTSDREPGDRRRKEIVHRFRMKMVIELWNQPNGGGGDAKTGMVRRSASQYGFSCVHYNSLSFGTPRSGFNLRIDETQDFPQVATKIPQVEGWTDVPDPGFRFAQRVISNCMAIVSCRPGIT
ncbi:hypothetical protein BS47DRAFT_1354432 [Hydnum rufescens UP504]|uniref:Uncharacterized protein n=1 Tax=Hydnum rufescens UP504 TaxID=1448309 RepID=A0A9P6AG25_9AGAM|nr:hypothetical protein BS47DRAFT_1354432 [Hydnum rufescens UP504]